MEWSIEPGGSIVRTELHQLYGGRRQGGVSPSAQSPNVMLFTDPVVGRRHGYYDGWGADDCFHYTGEGQFGDQQMIQGNRAILQHGGQGRALRLFRGVGGPVRYLGQFETDSIEPAYQTDAEESGGGELRQVIVFRLRPVGKAVKEPADSLPVQAPPGMKLVPIEKGNTETFMINPAAEQREGERRESKLVSDYRTYIEGQGSTAVRNRCQPSGEARPLFTDVFDTTRRNLIEAKGSVSRQAIRMAIGQLVDYERFVDGSCNKAVLLPERPRPDLEALLATQGIGVVWRVDGGAFLDNAAGSFT